MGDKEQIPRQFDLNAKWDACLDLGVRRFVYSSLAGAFGGLLLFSYLPFGFATFMPAASVASSHLNYAWSPVTRWASVALGAGVGIGSAYTECSYLFDGSPAKSTPPKLSETPASPNGQESQD